MEFDAKKIKELSKLSDSEFTSILETVAKSAGSDPATIRNIVKNSKNIKRMLANASDAELNMIASMLAKKSKEKR